MPIPDRLRKQFESLSVELGESPHTPLLTEGKPQGLPSSHSPGGWLICPGLYESAEETETALRDLDHRLHQAKLDSLTVRVTSGKETHAGRLVRGMSRSKAVGFGYKLRHWAVFELTPTRFLVVYTGHNSRSR